MTDQTSYPCRAFIQDLVSPVELKHNSQKRSIKFILCNKKSKVFLKIHRKTLAMGPFSSKIACL